MRQCLAALLCAAALSPALPAGCRWVLDFEREDFAADAGDGGECPGGACDGEGGADGTGACASAADCDDGEQCNGAETCGASGACAGGTPLADGAPCQAAGALAGWCDGGVCVPRTCGDAKVDPGEECDDGNDVEEDGCRATCRFSCGFNADCTDGNVCTTDLCVSSGTFRVCVHAGNHDPCSDGDPCTVDDTCGYGACEGTPRDCDDGNPCTADSCGAPGGCAHAPLDGGTCDDRNPCTGPVDGCAAGVCVPGDGNWCDCAADPSLCAEVGGADRCAGRLACVAGACVLDPASAVRCPDDRDTPCRKNACDPADGTCAMRDERDGTPCDDGNRCTDDDACAGGTCRGADQVDCDDSNPCTDDFCDARAGCFHVAGEEECSDGLFCTILDACDGAGDCRGAPRPCGDDEECTADLCDERADACVHVARPDGTPCGGGEGGCCAGGVCGSCPAR